MKIEQAINRMRFAVERQEQLALDLNETTGELGQSYEDMRLVLTELDRLQAENVKLIEAWPEIYGDTFAVESDENGQWEAHGEFDGKLRYGQRFATRVEAVRFAAGLNPEGGANGDRRSG